MKKSDELKKLMEKITSFKEVIIFPEGFEGKVLLDYLRYNRKFMWTPLYMQYVTCIAAENVFPPNNPNQFDHDLPVIPLENLVHFKDTALFVVATWPDRLEHVKKLFDDFDCKNVVYFSEKEYKQAQNALKLRIKNGDILSWKINNLTTELGKIKNLVTEQNEVAATNTKAFSEYRNAFRGKKVVIVGGGPTVNYYNPIPDAIHIGLNFAWRRENISFDYLFTQDARINIGREIKVEEGFEKIRDRIFLGKFTAGHEWYRWAENLSFANEKVFRYFSKDEGNAQQIYQDICCHTLMDFFSVSFCALHFALFTYPKEIYLVGCDTSNTGHFYKDDKNSLKVDDEEINIANSRVKVGYARAKMFAKTYYPDTEIISVNPVGLKGLFKDIYTDEYKNSLADKN